MAFAGHPAWVIQTFGRWESAVVLRYVRDALLGEDGGDLAQVTEGVLEPVRGAARSVAAARPAGQSLGGVRRRVLRVLRQSTLGKEASCKNLVARQVAENLLGSALGEAALPQNEVPVSLSALLSAVQAVRADFLVAQGLEPVSRVVSPCGMFHLLVTAGLTRCGWAWQRCPGARAKYESERARGVVCKSCLRGNPS